MARLKWFFVFVLIAMVSVSVWASLETNVIQGFQYLFESRWGIATLFDTYFSFLMIYFWMAYKDPRWLSRVIWLLLVLSLGTIAISVYVLNELRLNQWRLDDQFWIKRKN